LSHVTSPAGANCGAYTIEFAVADSESTAANDSFLTESANSLVIDFGGDVTQAKAWTITVTVYFTNYSDVPTTNVQA